jgi:hypothetical protein
LRRLFYSAICCPVAKSPWVDVHNEISFDCLNIDDSTGLCNM